MTVKERAKRAVIEERTSSLQKRIVEEIGTKDVERLNDELKTMSAERRMRLANSLEVSPNRLQTNINELAELITFLQL